MSFDTIQLPPFIVQELFKNSLIELNNNQTLSQSSTEQPFTTLGNNKKEILILISNDESLYLPEDEFNFLTGILTACKLTMDDIALLNIKKNKNCNYKSITKALKPAIFILFGVKAHEIELPLSVPDYQIQVYNDQTYVFSPALPILSNDRNEKLKLWDALKKIFSI